MDLFWQSVLGIATGVVTSAILFFIKDLWVKSIRPYLEELRYGGVSVEGTWRGYSRDEFHDSDTTLHVMQSAHNITGRFTFRFRSAVKQFTIEYDVTGYLWEGYLTLNFRPADKAITTSATGLFKIAGGGAGLTGQFCFRNVELEAVTALSMTMARANDGLLPGAELPVPGPAAPAGAAQPVAQPKPNAPATAKPAVAAPEHAERDAANAARLAQEFIDNAAEGQRHK